MQLQRADEKTSIGKRLRVVSVDGARVNGKFVRTTQKHVIAGTVLPLPAWEIEQDNGTIFYAFPERDTIEEYVERGKFKDV
jgi:hypothetical protein